MLNNPKRVIFLLFLIVSLYISAQHKPFYSKILEGNKLLLEENYLKAIDEYKKAYKFDSSNCYLNYKLGICYLHHPKEKKIAEMFLLKAIKSISIETEDNNPESRLAPPMALFYYATSLHLDYKFEEAIKNFEDYRKYVPAKFKEETELIDYNIQLCKNAILRLQNPTPSKIMNIGDSINDLFSQNSPAINPKTKQIYFSVSSPEVLGSYGGNLNRKGKHYSDIFFSHQHNDSTWSKALPLRGFVNSKLHENSPAFTNEGNELMFSRGDDELLDLYLSSADSLDWRIATALEPSLNSKYEEKSPFLSKDGGILFFSSNRKGGFGGFDIYRSKKLPNGKWGIPENLGPKINSKYDEDSPFPHLESHEFFFSSKGHSSMGGYDIFNISLDSNLNPSGDPVALAYPINSVGDDMFYSISPDEKFSFFSSDRQTETSQGDFDIYSINLITGKDSTRPEKRMVIYTGHILVTQNEEMHAKISINVTYKKNKELYGSYKPQRNGNFISALKPGNAFVFSYLLGGKEFFMEELEIPDSTTMFEIERKDTIKPVIKQEPVVVIDNNKEHMKKPVTLSLTVIDLKNFQPEPNARIVLKEDSPNGKEYEFYTDSKGIADSIILPSGNYYKLQASFREFIGEEEIISTKNIKDNALSKILYVFTSTETYNPDSLIHGKFIHYFEFNITAIEHFHSYQQFLDSIDATINRYGEITIAVKACASHLPTNFKGGLQALSKKRATDFEKKLIQHLIDIKKDPKKIKFELKFAVEGPEFTKDYRKKLREYEKHQYVEAYIKPNKKKQIK